MDDGSTAEVLSWILLQFCFISRLILRNFIPFRHRANHAIILVVECFYLAKCVLDLLKSVAATRLLFVQIHLLFVSFSKERLSLHVILVFYCPYFGGAITDRV